MLAFLPAPLLALVMFTGLGMNVVFFACLIILCMPLRFLMPTHDLRAAVTALLVSYATIWCHVNNHVLLRLLPRIEWDVELPAGLSQKNWYFVIANHQSWVDIIVLFRIYNGRIPFLKYFLKQELIWIPFLGLGTYALDFPFMKRYSRATLEKHPELKGKDMETTRRSCEKFRYTPVSVMNFLEGTRFTPLKHEQQQSPYRHLLPPKAGGMAFTLSALGEKMHALLDTTIVYPDGNPTFVDFLCGRLRRVVVRVQIREIPAETFRCDYENDATFRSRFQNWTAELWAQKDADISRLLAVEYK
ncbi:MAG: acyltransferase [Moraxellaceae bacterium]